MRNIDPSKEWYAFEDVRDVLGVSTRQARRVVADVRPSLVRTESKEGCGKPRSLYHFAIDPKLTAHHEMRTEPTDVDESADAAPVSADDLAVAILRVRAVKQFRELCKLVSESESASAVCRDWRKRPQQETVTVDERLPGGHIRKKEEQVRLPLFAESTLRRWAATYRDKKTVLALAPIRKRNTGRKRKDIPEELLDFVHALAVSTTRADVEKAVDRARDKWPGEFPSVCAKTWQRRIKERDPERALDTLGKLGIAPFRKKHSPDIDRDYSDMRYNQLFQLDDVSEDWYGHASDPEKLIRPYAYAVIRVATRQWICAVTAETPIVQDQVRSLVGLTMATANGGVPEEITFERGSVACDDYLENLLTDLGLTVHRTSMNGGKVHPGAIRDRAVGHFQGKGVIESNLRLHHDLQWDAPGSTGPDEKTTSHRNLEMLKREAVRLAKNGEQLILPTKAQWQTSIFNALEDHNNRPHGSMPEVLNPDGSRRHMSPNEYAVNLKDQGVTIMDEKLLPLFFRKGLQVRVNKNGFRLNDQSYGRFDEDLQTFAGSTVIAYGLKDLPGVAYVAELGRCVEAFHAPKYGEEGTLLEQKRKIEKTKRNKYEQLIARAVEGRGTINIDTVKFMSDPVPSRARSILAPQVLGDRADAIARGAKEHKDSRAKSDARFVINGDEPTATRNTPRSTSRRRGTSLLQKADELGDEVAAVSLSNEGEL